MLDVFPQSICAGLNSFLLLSFPLVFLMGIALAHSPAGKVAEKYMTAQVENLDKKFEDAYKAAGVKLVYMNAKDHAAWVEIAKKSSHKAFADKVPGGDKLMEMALAVK